MASIGRPAIAVMMASGVASAVSPSATTRPLRRTVYVSLISNTSSSRCETYRMATPRSCSWRMAWNSEDVSASVSAAVGSSRIKTRLS